MGPAIVVDGRVFDCGGFCLSAQDIIAFARLYDPQPFHVDPEAARESRFGGLIASSLQGFAEASRVVIQMLEGNGPLVSLGWHPAKFFAPIRPDTPYSVQANWTSCRPSHSHPGHVIADLSFRIVDEGDAVIAEYGYCLIVREPFAKL